MPPNIGITSFRVGNAAVLSSLDKYAATPAFFSSFSFCEQNQNQPNMQHKCAPENRMSPTKPKCESK